MTISELMAGVTPKPEYAGIANADDYVLAVDFSGTAENVGEYLVAIDGMTSHAAVVARGMGTCCVSGCGEIAVHEENKTFTLDGRTYHER